MDCVEDVESTAGAAFPGETGLAAALEEPRVPSEKEEDDDKRCSFAATEGELAGLAFVVPEDETTVDPSTGDAACKGWESDVF